MNFLQRKTSWSNGDIGLLKFCVLLAGLVMGIYFYDFFKNTIVYVFAVFLFLVIWVFNLWLRKKTIK